MRHHGAVPRLRLLTPRGVPSASRSISSSACSYDGGERRWKAFSPILSTGHTSLSRGLSPSVPLIGRRLQSSTSEKLLEDYKRSFNVPRPTTELQNLSESYIGKTVVVHGYLGSRADISKKLSFATLFDKTLESSVQIVSVAGHVDKATEIDDPHANFKVVGENSPVAIKGTVQLKAKPKGNQTATQRKVHRNEDVEIKLQELTVLNVFPSDYSLAESTVIGADQRHLQIRQSRSLRAALAFRSRLAIACRKFLQEKHAFQDVETPLLFKSTPEGAREFLVPTRTPGMAYALPQSPQQYKQLLMGSGVPRYYQIAKCFRDEDLRADRQPEFTQLDLEMAFASGSDVMSCVEDLVKHLWKDLLGEDLGERDFPRMSYEEAMAKYGSDKPDTRYKSEIVKIDHMIPVDLVSKISDLQQPIVEAFSLSIFDDAAEAREFVGSFMESPEALSFLQNPAGQPGIFIYDSRKPLAGLQPFGFEAAEFMEQEFDLEDGDVVIVQARENKPFSGGSTMIGNLRLAMHRFARSKGSGTPPAGWSFLWINKFPLFSPVEEGEPGQGGAAGICSTHHPFTAPASVDDIDLISSDPLQVKADHYDLVLNGVELGGGSRRIHVAEVQEHILRNVLKMSDERVKDFAHLIDMLRAGCPPHAGMALGFDRLCAVMLGRESIRDVIAFPKSGSGADPLVKSPTRMTAGQMELYHLALKEASEHD